MFVAVRMHNFKMYCIPVEIITQKVNCSLDLRKMLNMQAIFPRENTVITFRRHGQQTQVDIKALPATYTWLIHGKL